MKEMSVFDFFKTPVKINKPIRLIELFAGVGSQAKALKRLGADFEHYKISEWEVNATASYKAIHKENDNTDYSAEFTSEQLNGILFNIGISTDGKKPLKEKEIARKGETWKRTVYNNFKATNNIGSILNVNGKDLGIVDTDKYCYICSYSFPCQDLSLAGKGNGMAKGSGTRSGLLWEVERLLNECEELPQILLMENVTQVHGKKNKEHFDEWCNFLESKGYNNYWKDLNSKNLGIPQNRNRCFMVSVLGDYTYTFPKEFPLELRLKDILETEVDEKFYLSDAMIKFFTENTKMQAEKGNGFRFQPTDGDCVGKAVTTKAGGRMDDNFIKSVNCQQTGILVGGKWDKMHDVSRRVYSENGISPTIHTCGGGNTEPKVVEEPKIQKMLQIEGSYDQSGRVYSANGISPTVMSNSHGNTSGGYTDLKIVDPFICASRGRNPENPSDRTAGIPLEQRLEPNFSGCSNTLTTVQKDNYVAEPFINKIDIPQTVRVRKYEVDCEKLCEVLRDSKRSSGLNNQDIANHLNVPLTKVEHWFRQDKGFAIPSEDVWLNLKAILGIETNEFDESIMTFEDKEGVFEKSNRCYLSNGLAPIITSTSADEKIIEPIAYDEQNRYIRKDGCVGTLTTDGSSPKHNNRVIVFANNIKGYDEAVDGDSINLEHPNSTTRRGRVGHGVAQTLNTSPQQAVVEDADDSHPLDVVERNLRIRKLTPKECWRLMGFDDEDFEKAESVNSNTQLYKQAGNSIVVDVLYYIFREMF